MTRERREEWRREQLAERVAAEEAEATFKPDVYKANYESWGGGEPTDEELLERFERQATAHKEKQMALEDYIREEEKKVKAAPRSPSASAASPPPSPLNPPPPHPSRRTSPSSR